MTGVAITTRAAKGSPLTNSEVDANFSNLKAAVDAALPLAGGTLTGSVVINAGTSTVSSPVIDLTQTWNNLANTFTAIRSNITDTASSASSLLMDLQVGGTSKFQVSKDGHFLAGYWQITGRGFVNPYADGCIQLLNNAQTGFSQLDLGPQTSAGTRLKADGAGNLSLLTGANVASNLTAAVVFAGVGTNAAPGFAFTGHTTTGMFYDTINNALDLAYGGAIVARLNSAGMILTQGNFIFANNTILAEDATNVLALRSGTNGQQFNVYNTYTNSTNYERGTINWSSNVLQIGTQMAGTGVSTRALSFVTNATNRLDYGLTAAGTWTFQNNTVVVGNLGANALGAGTNTPAYTIHAYGTGANVWSGVQTTAVGGSAGFLAYASNGGGTAYTTMTMNDVGGYTITNNFATGTIGFAIGGTEQARFSGGKMSIGTTTLTGRLTLKQSADNYGGALALVRSGTTDNWQIIVGTDNKLYMGLNGANALNFDSAGTAVLGSLHTVGNGAAPTFETTGGVNAVDLVSHNGGGNYGSAIYFHDGATLSAQIASIASGGLWLGTPGNYSALAIGYGGHVMAGTTTDGSWSGDAILSGYQSATSGWAGSFYYTGSVSASGSILVRLDSTAPHYAAFYYGSGTVAGSITAPNTTSVAFNTTSDARLKDFKSYYTASDAAAIIKADRVRLFSWKLTGEDAVGWFAQDSYIVSPDLASPGTDDVDANGNLIRPWGVDQSKRTPYLWAVIGAEGGVLDRLDTHDTAIADLQAQINQLKTA